MVRGYDPKKEIDTTVAEFRHVASLVSCLELEPARSVIQRLRKHSPGILLRENQKRCSRFNRLYFVPIEDLCPNSRGCVAGSEHCSDGNCRSFSRHGSGDGYSFW